MWLSNFPVWLFDAEEPLWPTFGLKLVEKPRAPIGDQLRQETPRSGVLSVIDYLRSLVDTMMAAHDRLYIEESDFDRTIAIETLGVGTTEFDLSEERAMGCSDRDVPPRRSSWPTTQPRGVWRDRPWLPERRKSRQRSILTKGLPLTSYDL